MAEPGGTVGTIRLILHPGHPKCGSSSIQHALRSNVRALRERGVWLPPRRPNRIFLEACLREDFAPVERWLTGLIEEARSEGANTLVISSENLGVQQLTMAGRSIHEIFARHCRPVDVIYYIRRQDDWMVSMWQQWGHKDGASLAQFTEKRLDHREPDYVRAVRLFEDVYGGDRVQVTPIDGGGLAGGDLIQDFAQRAGLGALPDAGRNGRRNASMSGYLCDVLARVPQVYDQALVARVAEGRTDGSVRRLLERFVSSKDVLFNSDKRIMPADLRRRVLDHFEEENRWLHTRYFAHVPFDNVFGFTECDGDDRQALQAEVAGLKDVVAIQMEIMLKLLREMESREEKRRVAARLGRWARRRFGNAWHSLRNG